MGVKSDFELSSGARKSSTEFISELSMRGPDAPIRNSDSVFTVGSQPFGSKLSMGARWRIACLLEIFRNELERGCKFEMDSVLDSGPQS